MRVCMRRYHNSFEAPEQPVFQYANQVRWLASAWTVCQQVG